ncbi:conjugal transfer protein [Streptomyces sp. NPDC090106]|uniref:conjugal transfer protein n=1 Tax=Streptomyces sp. NPDC090106 TaxID=3365946 RepID=UPI003814F175
MRRALTRRPAHDAPPPAPVQAEEWDVDEPDATEDRIGGWSTGARANSSAVLRWAAWGLIVLSPVLGIAAFARASTIAVAHPAPTASTSTGTGSQGAAGFASLFVAQYLRAGEGDQNQLADYYPAAGELQLDGEPGRRHGEQLTVVRLRQTDPAVWSVTVAARIVSDIKQTVRPTATTGDGQPSAAAADSLHYFQVPVAVGSAAAGASGYTALAMPAEVAAPGRIKTPDLVYGPAQAASGSDPRVRAVSEFLTAYLVGTGELDRYLAPGTQIAAISPAPYTGVTVDQLQIEGDPGTGSIPSVPADGTRCRLLASVRATGHDTVRVPLSYSLTLKARAGRWEIASLDGAPAPAVPERAPVPAAMPTR